ncbi:hypothetical protein PLESTF_001217800 [Pleodorina starrii]|nr:hypothetical protein PLESTF_001217800 [Pleodorina starrii]
MYAIAWPSAECKRESLHGNREDELPTASESEADKSAKRLLAESQVYLSKPSIWCSDQLVLLLLPTPSPSRREGTHGTI